MQRLSDTVWQHKDRKIEKRAERVGYIDRHGHPKISTDVYYVVLPSDVKIPTLTEARNRIDRGLV